MVRQISYNMYNLMRNFNSVYNTKRFMVLSDSANVPAVGFSWLDTRTRQVAHVDLSGKPPEHRARLVKQELNSAAESHRYGLFSVMHQDGSLCDAMFVSGDLLWIQKNEGKKLMLR